MSTDDVRRTWDAEAPTYDQAPDHGLLDADARAAWGRLLGDALGPAPLRVAEMGCGTATVADLLADAGHRVDGIDLSPAMLDVGRVKTARHGDAVMLTEGDAQDPPLAAGAYDAVVCRHVLWALPDPSQAVARWLRLLRDGGRVVLVEGFWHTGAGLRAAQVLQLLTDAGLAPAVVPLTDPVLWGGETLDERYLVTADLPT
ncbi:class I SAM-dependent methyltransferase [Solicola sp. PLA-1-18]|uniref:class I SAM-dependent methyltransferase n=1 Tax=Solicola sp. PLA-1-18 TaxID=3380532 RepID=UPI003B7A9762